MATRHIFYKNATKYFQELFDTLDVSVEEESNKVDLPRLEKDALDKNGDIKIAVHSGGILDPTTKGSTEL